MQSYAVGRALAPLISAVLMAGGMPAFCQGRPPADSASSPYLLRIQRTMPESVTCVLLRHDGQFHLENSHGDHTKVFEGSLPSSKVLKVQHMLDNGDLARLSQTQPNSPDVTGASEILQISIFRADHWQNLVFVADNFGQRIPRSLDPLLNWMDALHKQPRRQLDEDENKNNCQSPARIELKRRP
jgi:hypothetical protein